MVVESLRQCSEGSVIRTAAEWLRGARRYRSFTLAGQKPTSAPDSGSRSFTFAVRCGAMSLLFGGLVFYAVPASAQAMLGNAGGKVHLVGSDQAVLESQEVRKELSCTVTPVKPLLGFDLRYHAGYSVTIPLKELAGSENVLNILFRVTSLDRGAEPAYFIQHYKVPMIEEDAAGDAQLEGSIDLGEGHYHVDWMMRDRTESVCSFFWDMEAVLGSKDRDIHLEEAAGSVEVAHEEQFNDEPPVNRLTPTPLKIKILVNFAPQNYNASTMRPQDTMALVSILRRIARQPEFGKFSVVAFNIQEQKVLYRQDSEDAIDFPALGDAMRSIKLGVVDTRRLQQKHGDTDFLTTLIQNEMSGEERPDALVFAGPKVMLDASVPEDSLKPLMGIDYPVFYVNYALNPQAIPWRDSIGRAIRVFRGTEYTISKPRDLWFSMTEMVSRIVRFKQGRGSAQPAP